MSKPKVVLDASVLLAVVLPEKKEHKEYARDFLYALDKGAFDIVMTQLCQHEIAAKLISKMRGGYVKRSMVNEFFEDMQFMRWTLDVDIRRADELLLDADRLGCRGYDAVYLRAALNYGAEIATLDLKLLPHLEGAGLKRWLPA